MRFFTLLLLCLGLTSINCTSSPSKSKWQKRSDDIATEYTLDFAEIFPERASRLGFHQFDKLGTQPTLKTRLLNFEKLKQWERKLQSLLEDIHDPNLKMDLEILLANTQHNLKRHELDDKEKVISIGLASQEIFRGVASLVNEQFGKDRQSRAVDRFKFYMSSKNKASYIQQLKDRIVYDQGNWENKTGPFSYISSERLQQYLKNSDTYVQGVFDLLQKTGRSDWQKEFDAFKAEVLEYNEFLKTKILPLTPAKTQLSRDRYELLLQGYGNFTAPEKMITEGRNQFQKDYVDLKNLARQIAKKHNLQNSNPIFITEFLKRQSVSDSEEARQLYLKSSERLESLIREHHLVSLPSRNLIIRLGSAAESKSTPVPHLLTPPLINNKGEAPEFVVPIGDSKSALPYDDFSHPAMAMALTAHEGRPGHDLQFQKFLSQPISMIRASYAFNSVNVEGWALYAEQIITPYLSVEEQFSFLQSKMWRVARYFLDPMLHLGQANQRFVIQVLHRQLGLSEALATNEYERYSFRSPGQAPSYYQGLLNIYGLKSDLEQAYGTLDSMCFHDRLLSFGLLPHDKLQAFYPSFSNCKKL